MYFCDKCKQYTMKNECPQCHGYVRSAHPAKFSPVDPYSKYRIATKQKHGILPTQQNVPQN